MRLGLSENWEPGFGRASSGVSPCAGYRPVIRLSRLARGPGLRRPKMQRRQARRPGGGIYEAGEDGDLERTTKAKIWIRIEGHIGS